MSSITLKSSLIKGLIAGIPSAIINSMLFYAFKNLGAINDVVMIQGSPLGVSQVIFSSIIFSLVAGFVYFIISIFAREAFRIFQRIAWLLLLISFLNPFLFIPDVPVGFAISLNIMHIVVAAAVIYVMKKHIPFLT
ncbi:MAG: DUF6069 family protein [Ignavibacteria bacterium]|jgi:hypothetical protein|nr:hypothetical protein LBMAG35_14280 [Chlorobiota bacterium]